MSLNPIPLWHRTKPEDIEAAATTGVVRCPGCGAKGVRPKTRPAAGGCVVWCVKCRKAWEIRRVGR